MPSYKYLIVGGGMTADSAAATIREVDRNGTVGIIGSEPDPPYDRPPLTKGLWKDKPLESIWRHTANKNVTLHLGRRVESINGPSWMINATAIITRNSCWPLAGVRASCRTARERTSSITALWQTIGGCGSSPVKTKLLLSLAAALSARKSRQRSL